MMMTERQYQFMLLALAFRRRYGPSGTFWGTPAGMDLMQAAVEEEPDVCGGCGHVIGARCATCGREMLCGGLSRIIIGCLKPGCKERVLVDHQADLRGPLEVPRVRA